MSTSLITDRPIVQSSRELLLIPVAGPDAQLVDLDEVRVSVAPAGGAFGPWVAALSYVGDGTDAALVGIMAGPTTDLGQLPLGTAMFRVKLDDGQEVPILPAGGLEVIA